MSEQSYFEQFKGEGDPYYETEWYDEYAITHGMWGDFIHAEFIDKDEAERELARLKRLFPDKNLELIHHHFDTPQRWNWHDGGWGHKRMPIWGFYGIDPDKVKRD